MIIKRAQRKTRREEKRFKRRTFISIVSIIIIVGSFLYIMNHDYLAINEVIIGGQKTLIKEDILEKVNDYLDEKNLGIIRKDNILLLNTYGVERNIKKIFPKIDEIDVRVNDGDQLIITIGERSAHSLWCISREYESVFDEECYFADKKGLLYVKAPYFSGSVYMKFFIEPIDEERDYIGTKVDVVENFEDFFTFLEELENQYPIYISQVSFGSFDDVVIKLTRVKNITYYNWQPLILYNQSHSYELISRNIGIVLNFEDFEKDFEYRPSALESIDVRFDGRVSYLFTPIGKIPGKEIKKTDEEIIETI